jgi:O-phosphoseryl-tRNA(Cys) synthetase
MMAIGNIIEPKKYIFAKYWHGKCQKKSENARKCHTMPYNAIQCQKMQKKISCHKGKYFSGGLVRKVGT